MEVIKEGLAVFKNAFLRNEEVIEMAEVSNKWRQGTAGQGTDPRIRVTDIHDMDPSHELHQEVLDAILDAVDQYKEKYPHCQITKGEFLRVGRYGIGGHYAVHSDSGASERILSVVMYLNGDMEGGELHFPNHDVKIKPEEGMIVLFPSNFLFTHASLPVTSGSKYVVISWFS